MTTAYVTTEDCCSVCGSKLENAETARSNWQAEAHRLSVAMEQVFGMNTIWPLADVLTEAAVAIRHLLGNHDCDCDGHEQFSTVELQLVEYAQKVRTALKEK